MFKEDFHTQILGPVWFLAKFLTTLVEEKEKEGRKRGIFSALFEDRASYTDTCDKNLQMLRNYRSFCLTSLRGFHSNLIRCNSKLPSIKDIVAQGNQFIIHQMVKITYLFFIFKDY